MVLQNVVDEIRIWEEDKYRTNVSYNEGKDLKIELKLNSEIFYNVFIEILGRKSQEEKLMIGDGILLTFEVWIKDCLLYTSPSPRDGLLSRMPSSA